MRYKIIGLIILLAALAAGVVLFRRAGADPVKQAVDELRQAGLDLDVDRMIRPGLDRAAVVEPFASAPRPELPPRLSNLHEYSAEQCRTSLAAYEQRRADRDHCETLIADGGIFPIAWQVSELYDTLLPHLSIVRALAQLAADAFRLRVAAGDAEGAMREWRFMADLTDRLRREPSLLSSLVAVAIDGFRTGALDAIAETGMLTAFSDAELRELQDSFRDETKLRASCRLALTGESVMILYSTPKNAGESEDARQTPELLTSRQGRRELAGLLRYAHRYIVRTGSDYSEFKDAGGLEAPDTPGWWKRASIFKSGVTILNRTVAQYRVSATGLALELYRRKYGAVPETLAQLVPEFLPAVPRDPFDGAELRYRVGDFPVPWKTAEGDSIRTLRAARVYSVGPDLVDHSGLRSDDQFRLDTVFFLTIPGD